MDTLAPLTEEWRPAEAVVIPLGKTERPVILALAAMLAVDLAIFA